MPKQAVSSMAYVVVGVNEKSLRVLCAYTNRRKAERIAMEAELFYESRIGASYFVGEIELDPPDRPGQTHPFPPHKRDRFQVAER